MKLKTSEQIGLLAVGVILTYEWVLKPLLEKLGLKETAAQTAVDTAKTTSKGNGFDPNFWQLAPTGAYLLPSAISTQLSNDIWNAFGFADFSTFTEVFGAIKKCKTKSEVSTLADKFLNIYGVDLLSFLQDPGQILPYSGLSSDHLQQIVLYVNQLPNYTP